MADLFSDPTFWQWVAGGFLVTAGLVAGACALWLAATNG